MSIPRPASSGNATRARSAAGFGLLEILIAVAVFLVAFGALTSSLVASSRLVHGNRESTLALEAAQSAVARLRGVPFGEVFARFNADPSDDPGGFGTAPGSAFAVRGLDPRRGDEDGLCGELQFPGDGWSLREDELDRGLGMPRDLSGDAAVDQDDHRDGYTVLPVRVRVDWQGQGGRRRLEFVTTLSELAQP